MLIGKKSIKKLNEYNITYYVRNVIEKYVSNPFVEGLSENFVFVDFETTGLDSGSDEIIFLSAVKYCDNGEVQIFTKYAKPLSTKVSKEVELLTGLSDKRLESEADIKSVFCEFYNFLANSTMILYLPEVELPFLYKIASLCGIELNNPYCDMGKLVMSILPIPKKYSLSRVSGYLGDSHLYRWGEPDIVPMVSAFFKVCYYNLSSTGFYGSKEGYLADKDSFDDGPKCLFILKEPNDASEGFWLKEKWEGDFAGDKQEITTQKSIMSKFKNRFSEAICFVKKGRKCDEDWLKELKKCAFANILPVHYESKDYSCASAEYQDLLTNQNYVIYRVNKLIEACNPKYIFLCSDSFKIVHDSNVDDITKENNNVSLYNNRATGWFERDGVEYYEIIHPSRSPKLKVEE